MTTYLRPQRMSGSVPLSVAGIYRPRPGLPPGAWVGEPGVRQRQLTSEGQSCFFTPERRKCPRERGGRGKYPCAWVGCPLLSGHKIQLPT